MCTAELREHRVETIRSPKIRSELKVLASSAGKLKHLSFSIIWNYLLRMNRIEIHWTRRCNAMLVRVQWILNMALKYAQCMRSRSMELPEIA
jgi:hypothetical protein